MLFNVRQVSDWTAWSRRSDIILGWSAWLRLWTLALRHLQPFSQTAGVGCGTVLWGIAGPHCATLGRILTDKWPDVINSLSRWFGGMSAPPGWLAAQPEILTTRSVLGFDTIRLQKIISLQHCEYVYWKRKPIVFNRRYILPGICATCSLDPYIYTFCLGLH